MRGEGAGEVPEREPEADGGGFSLLAYGSLLHPEELARHGLERARCTPVRVFGFRRSFCQEPSWRPAESVERGVLTVRPAAGEWFNALRIDGFGSEAVAGLDRRERGYRRTAVPAGRVRGYGAGPLREAPRCVLYLGREEKYNAEILPGAAYLELCVAGAAAWGRDFLRDFLETTFVSDGVPLLEHRPALRSRLTSRRP